MAAGSEQAVADKMEHLPVDVQETPDEEELRIRQENTGRRTFQAVLDAIFNVEEFKTWDFYRDILTEFAATFLFLFVTISNLCFNTSPAQTLGSAVTNLGVAMTFGGMIFILVYGTGSISGGHINPAVSFGMLLSGRISVHRTFMYMCAQVAGAIAGTAVVRGLSTTQFLLKNGGSNYIQPGFSNNTAFAAEVLGTAVLMFTVLAATDPKAAKAASTSALAPLAIGWAVFMAHMALIPIDGCSINPARSTGPAVVFHESIASAPLWVFWIAPLVGAGCAAIFYEIILRSGPLRTLQRMVV